MDPNKVPTEKDMIQNIKHTINVMIKNVCCLEKENCEIKNVLKNINDQMKSILINYRNKNKNLIISFKNRTF